MRILRSCVLVCAITQNLLEGFPLKLGWRSSMSESGSSRFKYAFVFCIGLGLIETNGTVWPWGAEVCALLSTILVVPASFHISSIFNDSLNSQRTKTQLCLINYLLAIDLNVYLSVCTSLSAERSSDKQERKHLVNIWSSTSEYFTSFKSKNVRNFPLSV